MARENLLGKNSFLFFRDETASAYLVAGCLTSNGISKSMDMTDGTLTKCDPNPESIPGKKSYEVSFDGVAVANATALSSFEAIDALFDLGEVVYWKNEITLADGVTKKTTFGKGYLTSFDREDPVDGEITFSGTLVGSGVVSATDLFPVIVSI